DRGTQSLLIYDRLTGEALREVVAHRDGLPAAIHRANSHASSTVASDGQRVFALFYNRGGVWITAYTLAGEQLWQRRVGSFNPARYQFGFGSSPRVYDGKVIFATEFDGASPGESGVFAVDAATGEPVWNAPRPSQLSYGTPAVATIGGRPQLLMSGNDLLGAYDAATGDAIWETPGSTMASCGTMVWDESLGLAFASGGYPKDYTLAVRLGGDNEIVWQNTTRCYEQSLLAVGGYVYGVSNSGIAHCWRGEDGKRMWRRRLGGGFSSSPLLVGDRIYVTNEAGTTYVFEANAQRFVRLAENQLGDSAYATPSVVGDRMYHRYAATEAGDRQEYLVALGE
ncbi:MAG: PQQ-binding-like beta-propeller repeat protein, partial [Planctomycetota bacterium]